MKCIKINNHIELNKLSKAFKRSNSLNSNKSLRLSYSNLKVKNNNINNSNNKSCKRMIIKIYQIITKKYINYLFKYK